MRKQRWDTLVIISPPFSVICRMAGGSGSVWMAVLLVAITVMLHSAQEVFGMSGKELEKKITENCNNYKSKKDPQKDPDHAKVDCKAFLDRFKRAFVNKDPKTIKPEAYDDLMNTFKLPEHKDQYLFWSGTADLFSRLIENRNYYFYHIHDTVFGFLDIPVVWCGKPNSNEIFTDNNCPDFKKFPNNAYTSYWKAASRKFAKAATGKVTVFLSDKKFYIPDSFFANDELPYLNNNKVTELRVLIVILKSQTKGACKDESLKQLKNSAGALKDRYSCRQILESKIKRFPPEKWWDQATPQ